MSAAAGFIAGTLTLTGLYAVLSSSTASTTLGGGIGAVGTFIDHLASPDYPGIPDLRTASTAAPAAPSSTPPRRTTPTP